MEHRMLSYLKFPRNYRVNRPRIVSDESLPAAELIDRPPRLRDWAADDERAPDLGPIQAFITTGVVPQSRRAQSGIADFF
jgi:hypothetical protein